MPLIMAAHGIPYVATAVPAFHLDLMNKVRKALAVDGPAYLHIFSTCPTGWGMKPEKAVEIGKLAANTKSLPLYEVVGGRFNITKKVAKQLPITDYLKLQRRFRHLTEEEIQVIQETVDKNYDYIERMVAATNDEPEE